MKLKQTSSDPNAKNQNPKISFFQLFKYSTLVDKILIFVGTICSIICGLLHTFVMMSYGESTGALVDFTLDMNNHSLNNHDIKNAENKLFDQSKLFVIKMAVCALTMILLTYLAGLCFSYSALNQIFEIKQLYLKKILNNDISWYDVTKTGDFAAIFTENMGKIEEGLGDKIGNFLFLMSTFASAVILALLQGWKLALVFLFFIPLSAMVMGLISWLSVKYTKEESEIYSAASLIAEEVLSAIRTVVAFDGQEKEFNKYEKHLDSIKTNNIKKSILSGASNALMNFSSYVTIAVSFWYGIKLILHDRALPEDERIYTVPNMLAVFFCTTYASLNFIAAAPYLETFGEACGAAAKVFAAFESKPTINLRKKIGKKLKNIKGNLFFENVYFHYPSRTDVKILKGFTLKVSEGETVALVGTSGCGKSTCIQLLQRFYDPVFGDVYVDNANVKDLNLTWLRSQIGMVGQEPILFATTIAENIRYGLLSATQEDIAQAAKKAKVHEFIEALPQGYNTVIGERGAQLSGGQKQRIAIARALIRRPKILLLDEATSALDTTSEAEVQAAIDAISGECTTIVVAHRLSTIRNANRIVVVAEGAVIEEGTHSELMAAKQAYYDLVQSQGLTHNLDNNIDVSDRNESQIVNIDPPTTLIDSAPAEDNLMVEKPKNQTGLVMAILKMSKPEWIFMCIGCILAIVNGSAVLLFNIVYGNVMGILADADQNSIRKLSNIYYFYIGFIGLITAFATILQIYSFGVVGENLTLRLRSAMFRHMLKQEMGWFDMNENGVGALCSKLSGEAARVQGAGGIRISTILNSLSTFTISYVVAFYYQWKLTLFLFCVVPIFLSTIYLEQNLNKHNMEVNQKHIENSANIAFDAVGNIRTVASLGCENIFHAKYVSKIALYVKNMKKQAHLASLVLGISRSILYFSFMIALYFGIKLMINDHVNCGIIIKVFEILISGCWSIGVAVSFSPNFQEGLRAADRVFKLLNRTTKIQNVDNPLQIDKASGKVEYHKVHFAYPTRAEVPILNGLDLAVLEGKTVALVGASGCGKSTLIQLLERFYNPIGGDIYFDDKGIAGIDLSSLRSQFGIVSQEPNLFDRSIAENIAYGANHRTVSQDEIVDAARSANIHHFISSLPLGYDTNLGSRGAQLSGGQKQRVAIARALIRNPRVLLLDEATSALDNESEKVVQAALDKAKKNRTCITIAHRLTTIQDADVICVLDQGQVAEIGTHTELMEKKKLYHKLYMLQSGQK